MEMSYQRKYDNISYSNFISSYMFLYHCGLTSHISYAKFKFNEFLDLFSILPVFK